MRNYTTRFMSRLFSATEEGDEELTEQVANDIKDAKRYGAVDTDEVRYEDNGDGSVSVLDKDNGEVTVAEEGPDGNMDLYAAPTENLESYLHPGMDGVTPGYQQGVPYEDAWGHLESGMISPNVPGYGLNPEAGYERSVEDYECGSCEEGEREFSVATDNYAVLKIFSEQEFCERIFAEVIESEETANVGDLKIEKVDDDTVVVTSKSTGDQAKVTLDKDEMQVDELSTKDGGDEREFSEDEDDQYDSLHVVGVDPINHVIVDAPEYDEESAQDLVEQLEADGVTGVEVFDNADDARDHAMDLMSNLGAETTEDVGNPVQSEFCDHTVFYTRFYSNHTDYMTRLFSEAADGIETSQEEIEDAIENGEEIENDDEIITPVDSETAIVEDKENGEFTKVSLDGDELECEPISKAEAAELTEDLEVEDENAEDDDDDDDEEEKDFSDYYYYGDRYYSDYDDDYYFDDERYFSDYDDDDIYSNYEGTKFFSDYEYLTDYQTRLFSDEAEANEDDIEKAIEDGEQIETDDEIITPVDSETAVIEDKETGEFTKAVMDDDTIDTTPISEEEADELTEDLEVEDSDDDEDEDEEEEKDFSDVWSNYDDTKFFSEFELLTDYQQRLFAEEADTDEEDIAKAIEDGEQVETDEVIITPVDSETAVVEDKDSGEFTKATLDDDGGVDTEAITEEEADDLTEDLEVEDNDVDEDEERAFSELWDYYYGSYNPTLQKFFAEADAQQAEQAQQGEVQQLFDAQGNPVPFGIDAQGNPVPMDQQQGGGPNAQQQGDQQQGGAGAPPVEVIEDSADQAVNMIQQAAQEAANQILQAKQQPVQGQEQDLQEAQFSEYEFLDDENPLISWLGRSRY